MKNEKRKKKCIGENDDKEERLLSDKSKESIRPEHEKKKEK